MSSSMMYKGYTASMLFDAEDRIIVGRVLDIPCLSMSRKTSARLAAETPGPPGSSASKSKKASASSLKLFGTRGINRAYTRPAAAAKLAAEPAPSPARAPSPETGQSPRCASPDIKVAEAPPTAGRPL